MKAFIGKSLKECCVPEKILARTQSHDSRYWIVLYLDDDIPKSDETKSLADRTTPIYRVMRFEVVRDKLDQAEAKCISYDERSDDKSAMNLFQILSGK